MIDCHVHSNFSADSDMPVEIACEAAIQQGLKGIAFTDHVDIDYPSFDAKFLINFTKYSQTMDELKEKYKGKLEILKGVEVGFQPHVVNQSDELVKSFDFDFVISSVHIIDRIDPYYGEYYRGKTKQQADYRYLEEILDSVEKFDNFDVVGHIGYIRRYSPYEDKTLNYSDYSDILDLILRKTIAKGKGIEINSSGLRGVLNTTIPDFEIVNRYKELGGEIISLGSDSHTAEYIGFKFDYIKDVLISLGFKYITHFQDRKPVFEKI